MLSSFKHCSKNRRRVGSLASLRSIEVFGLERPLRALFLAGGVLSGSVGGVLVVVFVGLLGGGELDCDAVLGGFEGGVAVLRFLGKEE